MVPRRPAILIAAALLLGGGCIGPQAGHRDGYEGPTGPTRPTETQLRGKVLDAVTSAPIAGAKVTIEGISSLSVEDGSYTLQQLTMLAATIEGTKVGYDTSRTLIPLDGGDRVFNVRLRANAPIP